MRGMMVAGLLFIGLGLYVAFAGPTYKSDKSVLKVGDFQATAEQSRRIPVWVGVLGIVGGVALIVAGSRRRA